jgi:hypothetical protein
LTIQNKTGGDGIFLSVYKTPYEPAVGSPCPCGRLAPPFGMNGDRCGCMGTPPWPGPLPLPAMAPCWHTLAGCLSSRDPGSRTGIGAPSGLPGAPILPPRISSSLPGLKKKKISRRRCWTRTPGFGTSCINDTKFISPSLLFMRSAMRSPLNTFKHTDAELLFSLFHWLCSAVAAPVPICDISLCIMRARLLSKCAKSHVATNDSAWQRLSMVSATSSHRPCGCKRVNMAGALAGPDSIGVKRACDVKKINKR